jgi:hypothetical protein
MSEYSFESRGAETVAEFHSESLALAEPPALSMPIPLELDSHEAEALRGAIGFLFSLITVYDELTLAALEDDSAGKEGSGPN